VIFRTASLHAAAPRRFGRVAFDLDLVLPLASEAGGLHFLTIDGSPGLRATSEFAGALIEVTGARQQFGSAAAPAFVRQSSPASAAAAVFFKSSFHTLLVLKN